MTPQFERLRAWWEHLYRIFEAHPPRSISQRPPEPHAATTAREPDAGGRDSAVSTTADGDSERQR